MKDIAFHISDITENSLGAGATEISIEIDLRTPNKLEVIITDNGCGMTSEVVSSLSNPFYTTRTTRKVGLGIPFLIQSCEQTGGEVVIESAVGKGTLVRFSILTSHIDAPPKGDIASALAMLMTGNPSIEFSINIHLQNETFLLKSSEIKSELGDIPISFPQVTLFIESQLKLFI